MNKIDNKQNITKIIMKPTAFVKCEIGGDWYKNELEILFIPNDYYPDYMEVQDWIMENIDGKTLNIEDVVDLIYDFISKEYKPKELSITDNIKGCRTHFDVCVTK